MTRAEFLRFSAGLAVAVAGLVGLAIVNLFGA